MHCVFCTAFPQGANYVIMLVRVWLNRYIYLIVSANGSWASTAASGVRTLYELLCDVETLEVPGSPIVEQT